MTITTAQIRGARAILNWSQAELATKSGLSPTSVGAIEKGQSTPRDQTLNILRKALENAGIEFIGKDGVRLRNSDVRILRGQQGFHDFYDDIYKTLMAELPNNRIGCISNVDERQFIKWLGDYRELHVKRMESLENIAFRVLISQEDNYTPGASYVTYRKMPAELFSSVPFFIYGSKLAIILFEEEPTVIQIDYPSVTMAYKIQFDDLWSRSDEHHRQIPS